MTGYHGGLDCWVVKLSPESVSIKYPSVKAGYLGIFPNPAQDEVCLQIPIEEASLSVYFADMLGRQFIPQIIYIGDCIDIYALPNGIYSIIATTFSGKVYSNKLTICR